MTITVINTNTKSMMEAHNPECADIARKANRKLANNWTIEIPAGQSIVQAIVNDLNDGFDWDPKSGEQAPWSAKFVRVMPCCCKEK